jgi:hypothetical protein
MMLTSREFSGRKALTTNSVTFNCKSRSPHSPDMHLADSYLAKVWYR